MYIEWSDHYNNSTVITNWLTVTIYQFLKLQSIFSLVPLLSSTTDKTFTGLYYMICNSWFLIGNRNCWFNPVFVVGSVFLIFLVFCDVMWCVVFFCFFFCLRSRSSVLLCLLGFSPHFFKDKFNKSTHRTRPWVTILWSKIPSSTRPFVNSYIIHK